MQPPEADAPPANWSMARSGYHAFSGLVFVVRRTPSLRVAVACALILIALGWALRLPVMELIAIILTSSLLIAVETLNTAVEMLCDFVHPNPHPMIGRVKDVAAAATAFTEVGGLAVLLILLGPPLWRVLHG